jgi:GNAT superfamily N-acetyltransferase
MNPRTKHDIRIRDAHPEEAADVGDVIRAAYAQFEPRYPVDWQRYFDMIGRMDGHFEKGEVILAEAVSGLSGERSVLAAVIFYPDGSVSGQGEWPAGWAGMLRLAVRPAHRGKGIGRALVDECIRRCRDRRIATLGLHTTAWMQVAPMYERMGFVRDESFDFTPRAGVYAFGYKFAVPPSSACADS